MLLTDNRVSFEEVVAVLGQPIKQYGGYSYWQCPNCRDSGNDNLMYYHPESLIKSWCCDSCKKVFGEIMKNRNSSNPITKKSFYKPMPEIKKAKPKSEIKPEWLEYAEKCNWELLEDQKSLDYILKHRGITKQTVDDCMIGIDKIQRRWVFPAYDEHTLVGFEYRPPDLDRKCIYKERTTPSTLAQVNIRTEETQALVILEGFIDAYTFYQHLYRKGQNKYFHVLTPVNGVNTVVGLLKDFDFSPYRKVILYLDSDKPDENGKRAGIDAMNKIKTLFPFVEITEMTCGCKDFNEHYLNCIKDDLSVIKPTLQDVKVTYTIEDKTLLLSETYWNLSDQDQADFKKTVSETFGSIGFCNFDLSKSLHNRDCGLLPRMKHTPPYTANYGKSK